MTAFPVSRTAGAVSALGAVGAAYWALMSSYSQALGPFPYRARPAQRTVALTFDDGPNEPFTSQIAQILADRQVSGTFFQVGRCVERHPGATRELAGAGHVIGNHSLSHEFSRGIRHSHLVEEVGRNQEILAAELGRRPALYRPPWLLRPPALFRVLADHGLAAISGEFCHALEVAQPAPERIARRAVAKVDPGRIIIFHDGFDGRDGNRASTVAAVALTIDRLQADGYSFTTVDRLLGIPAYHD